MKLNHANLCTTDVAGLAAFFTRHFGFELVAMRGKDAFAILRGTDGFALNLMRPGKGGGSDYPDGFHIGFLVDDAEGVHAMHAEMTKAGVGPDAVQNLVRGGAATTVFYCNAPGGLLVEVGAETA